MLFVGVTLKKKGLILWPYHIINVVQLLYIYLLHMLQALYAFKVLRSVISCITMSDKQVKYSRTASS